MVPHYQPCGLVCCLTIGHAFWCGASLSTMPIGVLPHYRPCFWYGASSSTMPVGVVSHYRPCLLAWYLTIGHVFWSIATAINILLVERRWKKGGYKSGGNCTEVPLYQTCLTLRHACLYNETNIRHACWVHEFIYACL